MIIKGIVFDVDDTLYDQQLPFQQAMQQAFPQLLEKNKLAEVYRGFRKNSDRVFPQYTSGNLSLEAMRLDRIRTTLLDFGFPSISSQEATQFQQLYLHELATIKMQANMQELLDYLRLLQIPLGIITNGPEAHQKKKINQLQTDQWIKPELTLISGTVKTEKPQPEIFHYLADKLAIEPQNLLYIGDSFENDIIGAYNAGWHSLWLNHRQNKPVSGHEKALDLVVHSYQALLPFVPALLKE